MPHATGERTSSSPRTRRNHEPPTRECQSHPYFVIYRQSAAGSRTSGARLAQNARGDDVVRAAIDDCTAGRTHSDSTIASKSAANATPLRSPHGVERVASGGAASGVVNRVAALDGFRAAGARRTVARDGSVELPRVGAGGYGAAFEVNAERVRPSPRQRRTNPQSLASRGTPSNPDSGGNLDKDGAFGAGSGGSSNGGDGSAGASAFAGGTTSVGADSSAGGASSGAGGANGADAGASTGGADAGSRR